MQFNQGNLQVALATTAATKVTKVFKGTEFNITYFHNGIFDETDSSIQRMDDGENYGICS